MLKTRKTEIAFFVLGVGMLSYLVSKFGVDKILANIQRAGWSLVYVIGVWFVIYLLNTISWKLVLGKAGKKISFPYLFMVTVSGFVLNYITPVVALGGEPYKVKKLSDAIGATNSLSAVVLYRMVHLLGHMLMLLTGIVAAITFLPISNVLRLILAGAGVVITLVIMFTLAGHRNGIFRRLQKFFGSYAIFSKISRALQAREESLEEMDAIVTETFRNSRGTFYLALISEYISRALMAFEVYLIVNGIGVEISIVSALFMFIMYSIIINLFFFIPMNIGAREGGLYLGLESLALPPLLSIYFGIVMRIREFVWVLLGLLFILLTNEKQPVQPSAMTP
ncbi:MAG TPA: lysylphosphatidylglycerol synthase transmembrane domain-containing protein [Bacteroidota bacterium]|nr:lysylphosphatidylglycerol synthase transmembrane domain-containing protein [Bacteroidota bacterium]